MKRFFVAGLFAALVSTAGASAPAHAQASDPLLGQISWVGFNFCPRGWMEASGQLLAISSNTALFSLFGTMYGGDGRTTFALPDLRGRVSVHAGQGPGLSNYREGQRGGSETVTLNVNQMPNHTHVVTLRAASLRATQADPSGALPAKAGHYRATAPDVDLGSAAGSAAATGGSQPHSVLQPYTTLRACVAVQGSYPSRN